MSSFKRVVSILSMIGLLSACHSVNLPIATPPQTTASANCPPPPASLPDEVWIAKTGEFTRYLEPFGYAPEQIVADGNTIRLMAQQYDFVFCRGDRTWTVQPGTLSEAALLRNLPQTPSNPESIDLNGKTYQYRVLAEPNLPNEPGQIVFELSAPDRPPQRQVVYRLQDLQQAARQGWISVGAKLGQPRITAALSQGDRLWWTVAFEQGEGFGGVATVISYDPQTDKMTLIQPPELWWQQILDLAVTGDRDRPTLWMGTKTSAEGRGNIPTMGLVAYSLDWKNPNAGSLQSYTVHNSPLVGAIPTRLHVDGDKLWVGTRNGACEVQWQDPSAQNWSCWRFTAMAQLPSAQVPLYDSLLDRTPATTLTPQAGEIEVLWWTLTDPQGLTLTTEPQQGKGRYEVRYAQGFAATLNQGAMLEEPNFFVPAGKPPVHWMGEDWTWNGDRFVRTLDQVEGDRFGGGDRGIGTSSTAPLTDWYAMRGDLDLVSLTADATSVRYYSGWVEGNTLKPYPAVVPQARSNAPRSNPLAGWSR